MTEERHIHRSGICQAGKWGEGLIDLLGDICKRFWAIAFVLGCLSSVTLNAEDRFDVAVRPPLGPVDGVLVLCPGMNGDGSHFLAEKPWMDFADQHNLGVIALKFSSDSELMYGPERQGYYWPEQGSGDALLQAIEENFGVDQNIVIYGFSGGAHFTSRFVEWVPERVLVWSAYSAQFWDSPKSNDKSPPGIVACGEFDGGRWFPSYAYFYEGREMGKPWTWVSIAETGHFRKGPFEKFVREYFGAVLSGKHEKEWPVFIDIDTEEQATGSYSDFTQPELLTWLPTEDFVAKWRQVHHP
ncbi:hypothetical protein [Cerasicoccus arenae]|uniref:Alpha/beta hydrolase n=1 Tax=Cerasicoccus arenae TaxID=424488 RepID=A0A8J3DKE2_9BACT|nr:hypothetical protein [Cerasicoccus arenae]MBK1857843.1 hypothetical protein [Cerasicoccus arenae]GHC11537.1 hypothetical protein GCM10007047_31000 [Cerasicoccus arenae]